jgi:hypothetical protein
VRVLGLAGDSLSTKMVGNDVSTLETPRLKHKSVRGGQLENHQRSKSIRTKRRGNSRASGNYVGSGGKRLEEPKPEIRPGHDIEATVRTRSVRQKEVQHINNNNVWGKIPRGRRPLRVVGLDVNLRIKCENLAKLNPR